MAKQKITSIGGQALIEGILMKGPERTALAVRRKDGSIDLSTLQTHSVKERFPVLGWPLVRGIVNLVESLIQGYRAMMLSAEKSGYLDELDETDDKKKAPEAEAENEPTATETPGELTDSAKTPEKKTESKNAATSQKSGLVTGVMAAAVVLAVVLCLALFIYLPALLFNLLNGALHGAVTPFRSLFEGLLKMAIFVGYVAAVSQMKDIRRVFQYHGAEHKSIFCYEAGEALTVENVRRQRRFHPRCGTSFLLLILIVSILLSSVLAIAFPVLTKPVWLWVIVKLLLVPLVCGIGYELIRVCGRHDNPVTRIIAAPGLWLQRITTKEPDDSMIEIAIAALTDVIPADPDADRW